MKKIFWVELTQNTIQARATIISEDNDYGLNEQDIDPIQFWCEKHNCGRRTSFDTFQFKSPNEKTLFLLKWS